jgi:hypothetical protein
MWLNAYIYIYDEKLYTQIDVLNNDIMLQNKKRKFLCDQSAATAEHVVPQCAKMDVIKNENN